MASNEISASSPASTTTTLSQAGIHSIRLPPFLPDNPELSLLQYNALLSELPTEIAKYNALVGALPPSVLIQVQDSIAQIGLSNTPYEHLKALILDRVAESEDARLSKLFQKETLGDRTPSQLLSAMLLLLPYPPVGNTASMVRHLFIDRLPQYMREILVLADSKLTLRDLAIMADKVHVQGIPHSHTSSQSVTPSPSSSGCAHACGCTASAPATVAQSAADPPAYFVALQQQMMELSKRVADLAMTQRSRPRSQSRRRYRSPSNSSSLCWYHFKFGDKATKCIRPCSHDNQKNTRGRP